MNMLKLMRIALPSMFFVFCIADTTAASAPTTATSGMSAFDQAAINALTALAQRSKESPQGSWSGTFLKMAVGIAFVGYGLGKYDKYLQTDLLVKKQDRAEKLGVMNIQEARDIADDTEKRRFYEMQLIAKNPNISQAEFRDAVARNVPKRERKPLPKEVEDDYKYLRTTINTISSGIEGLIASTAGWLWLQAVGNQPAAAVMPRGRS